MSRNERVILGIIDSKPSSVAILGNGRVEAAVAEERLNRQKLSGGVPRSSLARILDLTGLAPSKIEHIAVAQNHSVYLPEPIPWSGWFQDEEQGGTAFFDQISGQLAALTGDLPLARSLYYRLKQFRSRERRKKLPVLLAEQYGLKAPVTFYDHHYCHATTAFFGSGYDEALVVTLDGGGDGLSGTIYLGKGGRLQCLQTIDSYHSLGNFYSYITELCGYRAEKHEGKITGLAAYGKPVYADILRSFISYHAPGQIIYKVPMYHRSALQRIASKLPDDFEIADLAASVQLILEEIGESFVKYWLCQTKMSKVAVAGGVFANVKFNQRLFELPEVDEIFVYPAMDDSGLSVGAGLAYLVEQKRPIEAVVHDVYWGTAYDNEAIAAELVENGLVAQRQENIHQAIAEKLARGKVVARFTGRMEFGPRALGHRSILYQTTDPSVNDWLNELLNRTEFMPFAPATLMDHADKCYQGINGAHHSASFMTITFNCTEQMKQQSPGVVHIDGTARPQLVSESNAPDFHKILTTYFDQTQIPSLINTSFNMHGEPIVESPADAIRSFLKGRLDFLAIGDYLVPQPNPAPRKLTRSQDSLLNL